MKRLVLVSALLCVASTLGCAPQESTALEASLQGDEGSARAAHDSSETARLRPASAADGLDAAEERALRDADEGGRDVGANWSYTSCTEDEALGGFQVLLAEDYTGVSGQVRSGVVPSNVPELISSQQGCRLLKARSLYCDPQCVPGETCAESGVCIDYPGRVSLGEVKVSGMKEALTMEAKWGNTYTNQSTLPHPGYLAGADLLLVAQGEELEGFSLRGFGVAPLEMTQESVTLSGGQGLALTWATSGAETHTRLRITLNVNNHGSTSAWLACEVEDSGAFTIPAALLDALQAIGVSGFPSLSLARQSVDAVRLAPGCVEFAVRSERDLSITIDGLKSCTRDAQCPSGQSCGSDLACH